jgi:hypothetical protein
LAKAYCTGQYYLDAMITLGGTGPRATIVADIPRIPGGCDAIIAPTELFDKVNRALRAQQTATRVATSPALSEEYGFKGLCSCFTYRRRRGDDLPADEPSG